MTLLLLLLSLALGADVEPYPHRAAVELPAEGVVRIAVPLDLRSTADPDDASDLLLVDGEGGVVPLARIASDRPPERVELGPELSLRPTADPDRLGIVVRGRPVDALEVTLPGAPASATVTVEQEGRTIGGPILVWHTDADQAGVIDLEEPLVGPATLTFEHHLRATRDLPSLAGLRLAAPDLEPHRQRVQVDDWRLQENGWARYDLFLPRAWPASRVVAHPTDDLFERHAEVIDLPQPRPGTIERYEPHPRAPRIIERILIGDAQVESTSLPAPDPPADRLGILVEAEGKPALDIPEATVVVPAVHLVVRDPGPGPHVLYGGAPPGTSPAFDLSAAAPELVREAGAVVEPGPVEANPAWTPPEVRSGLVEPGPALSLDRFAWAHQVSGAAGLARIPLPAEALAGARRDLGDLRLVDAQGRQIPYVLRRYGGDHDLGSLAFERTEREGRSILEAPLPVEGVPLSTATVGTDATVFSRRVTVARPRGARLETLRAWQWIGTDRPERLVLDVGRVVGDTLMITIDNGDDAPLPVGEVRASWPAWELWASLPADGVRLVYGDPELQAPEYDLALLQDAIGRRVAEPAAVGPRKALDPPPPSLADKLLTGVGVGILALGLLVLVIRLIVAAPEAVEPPEEAPTDPGPPRRPDAGPPGEAEDTEEARREPAET